MLVRKVSENDKEVLFRYFQGLSPETLKRFGTHPFDEHIAYLISGGNYQNCSAICLDDDTVVAYSVVKSGYVGADVVRYANYPISIDCENDYTLAPSVADAYQSKGVEV